ncbi:YdcH family protein [Terrihabitans sp. B22-R8]|uniref:YdcH family protein n=1 Tax=Terrihabitans sp. B22-R8 TaxID=3425128 RepID=UPI00403C75FE
MSVSSHLTSLESKHEALEREIETELSHPNVDDVRVQELKRRKLKIKDQITRLKPGEERPTLH